jgi:AcrR family transcriptional regulator
MEDSVTLTLKQQAGIATREKILTAAVAVITGQGAQAFTLDAVARQAGVSKGGLLHHFASKDALLEGLLTQLFERFNHQAEIHYEREHDAPGRWLRAYIRTTFDQDAIPLEISAVMLSGIIESRHVLGLIEADARAWDARLHSDGLPPARVQMLRLACDSLWTQDAFGPSFAVAGRDALLAEMLGLAGGDAS